MAIRCMDCPDRYPGCQDHCEYGIKLKTERERQKKERAKAAEHEVHEYYRSKKYRR